MLSPLAQQTPAEAAARASEIQRRQEQELEAQRARAAQRPDVLSAPEAPSAGEGPLVFPQESPCFVLREVTWDGAAPPADLRKLAATAVGPCVGGLGLKTLQEHLHARLIDQGRVTARVLVPEQSLAAGTLTLRYVPGRISAVQSEGAAGWWRTALPTGPGGELNQRDLDRPWRTSAAWAARPTPPSTWRRAPSWAIPTSSSSPAPASAGTRISAATTPAWNPPARSRSTPA
ncbi:POTRA domain-containing protein [Achromobacter xylosoxidans]